MSSTNEFQELIATLKELPEPKRRIRVFETVRDIAYGDIGSREPLNVLKAGKGTCSGKHALLKLLLETLDYEVQSWFAKHDFGKFPIEEWPEELKEFKGEEITDYHDFLKIKIGNRWVTVDAVFDAPLAALGFPLLEWDGESDMELPIEAEELFKAERDMGEHKRKLIAALPGAMQNQRKHFLATLTGWLNAERTKAR